MSDQHRYSLTRIVPPTSEPITVAEAKQQLRITHSDEDTLIESYITAAREWAETFLNRTLVKSTWKYQTDTFPYCLGVGEMFGLGFRLPRPPLLSVSSITYIDLAGTEQTLSTSIYDVDHYDEPGIVSLAYLQLWPITQSVRNAITITYLAGYGGQTKTLLDLASVVAGQTITINGIAFTAHATTTTVASRQFSVSGSNTADATELTTCINDATYGLMASSVNITATSSGARVTLTAYPGTDITATPSASTITVSTNYECTSGESIDAVPVTIKHAIKLLVAHWYEHRESVAEGSMAEIPQAVQSLLWSEKVLEFAA